MTEQRPARELTLGTAGHIDHGKTALVGALTGTETDRLEEERRRGISIELGFAELELPGGRRLGVVDVPGHRRLVRAMVAGATGIDMFLLVVAADDGVMPQTREHWTALRALAIDEGVIALAKVDAAPEESLAIARAEVAEFAPGVPVVEVSARTGEGLDELRAALAASAERAIAAGDEEFRPTGSPVLHLDRAFTLRGIGTVVTGTLRGGPLTTGARVRVLPSERAVRVRSVQVHGRQVKAAYPGQRAAVNLVGIGREDVEAGDVIAAEHASLAPSYRLDVELGFDASSVPGERRVQVHHGTRSVAARIVPLGAGTLAQLRLESPLIAEPADRLVIRRIAPPDTLGGGVVIDPAPTRHGPGAAAERLREAAEGDARAVLLAALAGSPDGLPADPDAWGGLPLLGFVLRHLPSESLGDLIAALAEEGELVTSGDRIQLPGGGDAGLAGRAAPAPVPLGPQAVRVFELLDAGGLQPAGPAALAGALRIDRPVVEEALRELTDAERVVRLRADVHYPVERLGRIVTLVSGMARERDSSIGLAELRDELRVSRKYSQAILEHLDATGVTVRHGDRHTLRRPSG